MTIGFCFLRLTSAHNKLRPWNTPISTISISQATLIYRPRACLSTWKAANPALSGNLRDHANTEQLLVLANLQSLNAKLLEWDSPKEQRLEILNKTAREQMEILVNTKAVSNLKQLGNSGTNLIDS